MSSWPVLTVIVDSVERWIGLLGGLAALVTLCSVLQGLWQGLHRPKGRATGLARWVLRAPAYLLMSVGFFGACYVLWRPFPLTLSAPARLAALALGTLLYFPALALILWARLTLGEMYNVSSSMGVELYAGHRLITSGPFGYMRHPTYLGILVTGVGGLLIYRTWTLVLVVTTFLGLMVRARREERALAAEFGCEWDDYCRRVPAWMPRLQRRGPE